MPQRTWESLRWLKGVGQKNNKKPKEKKKKKKILFKTRQARDNHWQKLTAKMENDKRWYYADTLTIYFNKYIRNRDKNKKCISYWAEKCENKIQHACHFIPCEWYSHRWDEDNVFGWCASCNAFNKQEHQKYMTMELIRRFGIEKIDKMNREKHKKAPDIEWLKEKILYYKSLVDGQTTEVI